MKVFDRQLRLVFMLAGLAVVIVSSQARAFAAGPIISHISITNVRAIAFTVSWFTDTPTEGHILYGTAAPLTLTGTDDRGPATVSRTHYVVVDAALLPGTTYYFDVVSGSSTDDNGGSHYQVKLGPSIGLQTPGDGYGQVFYSDHVTLGTDAIVYVTIQDADGSGSSGKSQALSALVDEYGYWSIDLRTARIPDLSQYYAFSSSDILNLFGEDANGVNGSLSASATEESASPDLILQAAPTAVSISSFSAASPAADLFWPAAGVATLTLASAGFILARRKRP